MRARGGASALTRDRWGRRAAARLGGFTLLLLAAGAPAAAAPGQLAAAEATGWQLAPLDAAQRIVVDLTKPVDFKIFRLSEPDRVVVDMPEIDWHRLDHAEPLRGGWVARVRYGVLRPGISRLVVDATQPLRVRSAVVTEAHDGIPCRLVLDLEPEGAPLPAPVIAPASGPLVALAPPVPTAAPAPPVPAAALAPPDPAPPPRPSVAREPPHESPPARAATADSPAPSLLPALAPAALAGPLPPARGSLESAAVVVPILPAPAPPVRESPRRENPKRVVVIDPGHGGVDPGATSLSGVYEKTITLAVGEAVERALNASGRYKVVLTRSDDTFIRLRDRVAIARQVNADLFISIHADSLSNHAIGGMSIYTLSETASDHEAEALAAKENKADIIAGVDLRDESPQVSTILIDLAQRETKNLSAKLARDVIDEVGHDRPLLPRPHRFAGFAVLTAPDVPSILIELGYLSNRTDEHELLDAGYRERLARGIARAVDRFFAAQGRLRRS